MFGFRLNEVREYFKKAAPVMLNEAFWGLGSTIVNVMLANLGYVYYAAVTIFRTFENVGFVFLIGLCSACGIMVGKSVGAGEIRQAKEDAMRFVLLMPLTAVALGIIVILFRGQLVHVFNLSGNIAEETVKVAKQILLVYALEIPVRNIPYILNRGGCSGPGGDTGNRNEDGPLLALVSVDPRYVCSGVYPEAAIRAGVCHHVCSGRLSEGFSVHPVFPYLQVDSAGYGRRTAGASGVFRGQVMDRFNKYCMNYHV